MPSISPFFKRHPAATRGTLALLLSVTLGCAGHTEKRAPLILGTNQEAVPLPKGMSPTGLFTTDSRVVVIKTASDAYNRALYSWEPRGQPVLIVKGRNLDVARLSGDTFVAWFSADGHQQQMITMNGRRLTSQPVFLPDGGPRGWDSCEGDVQYVVCTGDRLGMTETDREYDETGFTAILVVNLARRKTRWFSVKDRTKSRFDGKRQMIYVVDWEAPTL